jgi:hypothetical protein
LVIFLQLLVFGSKLMIDIYQIVDLLVEHINISQQVIILFLTFDESILNLNDISEACCLLDCVKSLVNNFHISLIVVYEFDFLLIIDYKFSESLLQNCCCIILYSTDLSCFNFTSFVEFGIFKLFVELSQPTIIVCFVLFILHFQT